MDLYQVSQDSRLTKFIDGLAVLIIGVVIGIALTQAMTSYEVETIQTTKIIRRVPASDNSDQGTVEAPLTPVGPKIEEG